MADQFDRAAKAASPRDAQKGGQGALSKEHPEIPLVQDTPTGTVDDSPSAIVKEAPTLLTASQIDILCRVEEGDESKLENTTRHDLDTLLREGYLVPIEGGTGTRVKLTAKGVSFLGKRGAGLNEA